MFKDGAEQQDLLGAFRRHWQVATADSNLTLHGFRRFKKSHLLNLRFLEDDIAQLDHKIYQTALSMDIKPLGTDRLGLSNCIRKTNLPPPEEIINRDRVIKLRDLLQSYDDTPIPFNQIMAVETFSLVNDKIQSRLRTSSRSRRYTKPGLCELTLILDRTPTPSRDRYISGFGLSILKERQKNVAGQTKSSLPRTSKPPLCRNSILISEILGRVITILVTILFLILPLALLSQETDKKRQLIIVSVFILFFALIVAMALKMPSYQIMAVCAAYAAVLSTFVS
ncbi:hypothetical protein PspLS_11777 [Pyricularia sp. CBS 133598]|nr:hypothetical protein PspLS_11777 [Pyricularia sp. CBS 133598]